MSIQSTNQSTCLLPKQKGCSKNKIRHAGRLHLWITQWMLIPTVINKPNQCTLFVLGTQICVHVRPQTHRAKTMAKRKKDVTTRLKWNMAPNRNCRPHLWKLLFLFLLLLFLMMTFHLWRVGIPEIKKDTEWDASYDKYYNIIAKSLSYSSGVFNWFCPKDHHSD